MGIASRGVAVSSGSNLAIAGVKPSGVAIQGNTVWLATVSPPWQLLASAQGTGTGSVTMDTTGANLIVLFAASAPWGAGGLNVFSDNQGNPALTLDVSVGQPVNPAGNSLQVGHWINPNTSANHIITFGGQATAVILMAFKGPSNIAVGQIVGIYAGSSASSVQLPSMTPVSGSLVLTTAVSSNVCASSIDSNFVISQNICVQNFYANAVAYRIADGSAIAPIWTMIGTGNLAAAMISFIPSP